MSTDINCPKCKVSGLENFRKNGFKQLKSKKLQRYQCKECGHLFVPMSPSDLETTLPENIQKDLKELRAIGKKQHQELRDEQRAELRKVGDEFLAAVKEEVDSAVLLVDSERLRLLVDQVNIILDHQVMRKLQEAGLQKEITALCDKAGENLRDGSN